MLLKIIFILFCLLFKFLFVNCEIDFSKCGMNDVPPDQIAINYDVGYWPWMGSLGFWSDDLWYHQCGATLINQIHFITAAHCVKNETQVLTSWKIRHGDYNLEKPFDDGNVMDLAIEQVFRHPKYRNTAYYDIAVLQVAPIRPVCLPDPEKLVKFEFFKVDQYEGRLSTLIGWGSKETSGETSATLKRTILTIYEYSYCNTTYGNTVGEANITVHNYLPQLFQPNLLCAGYETSEQGSCKGDSGGPLMIFNATVLQYFQIGLVSGGVSKCGDKNIPSYFTRLDYPEIANFIKFPDKGDIPYRQPEGCKGWWQIEKDNTCADVARFCNIDLNTLLDINGYLRAFDCAKLPFAAYVCCRFKDLD